MNARGVANAGSGFFARFLTGKEDIDTCSHSARFDVRLFTLIL